MTLVNDLKKICKEATGSFISIDLKYPTVISILEKNKNIKNGYLLEFDGKKRGKGKNTRAKKFKNINIKKLRKTFVKKSVDTIVCNYEEVQKYMRFFVKDSVYINKGKLYLYGKKEEFVLDDLQSFYKRYRTAITITEYDKDFLMEIDNSQAKNNFIKDKIYSVKDMFVSIINLIGDIMIG